LQPSLGPADDSNVLQKGGDRVDDHSRVEPLAWLLHQPAVTAPIIGPRTRDQLTASQRALEVDLADEALRRLDEIWPGPSGEAPQAYAW
jgi:aryl-alcohol dehydrogenase-like predicted oxidoreductase